MISADPEDDVSLSPAQPSPLKQLPMVSSSPPGSDLHHSLKDKTPTTTTSVPSDPQTKPFSPRPLSAIHLNSDKPQRSNRSAKVPRNVHLEASVAPGDLNLSLDSDQGAALAFPSTTWSSCPSQQRTTPRSGSAAKLTPSPSVSRLESHSWPVLPPISPARGEKWAWPHMGCSQPPPYPATALLPTFIGLWLPRTRVDIHPETKRSGQTEKSKPASIARPSDAPAPAGTLWKLCCQPVFSHLLPPHNK